MFLNDKIVDIEKPGRIYLLTFIVNDLSGLFLHSTIFSIKHSRSTYIINEALSDFWYWLNCNNILASSEGMITLQKSLFSHTFHVT